MNKEALEALKEFKDYICANTNEVDYALNLLSVIEQALTQEVSKDTNVEEVEEALDRYSKLIERVRINNNINLSAQDEIDYLKIRNYINNAPKDVPNQSAKMKVTYGACYGLFNTEEDKEIITLLQTDGMYYGARLMLHGNKMIVEGYDLNVQVDISEQLKKLLIKELQND